MYPLTSTQTSETERQLYPRQDKNPDQHLGKRCAPATADFVKRKRTAVACQFCRLRKTKCDNVRPRCGYCTRQRAKCVYGDVDMDKTLDESAEPGVSNELLLSRLDEIKDMLQQQSHSQTPADVGLTPSTSSPTPTLHHVTAASPSATPSQIGPVIDQRQGSPRSPFDAVRCESLLRWPALAGVVRKEDSEMNSFPLSIEGNETSKTRSGNESGRGINEDSFVPLCKRFLDEVHPRNPVLDDRQLMRHARRIAEDGLGWDSASCLVLLACGLACYTTPWIKLEEQSGPLEDAELQRRINLEDKAGAEAYYAAAQKRLGLLGNSIQDIQCFFFATIFEKFSLRPLQAWFHVQQACNRLEARLLQRGERPFVPFRDLHPENYDLEQRLYWSCFRAESEFVYELGMRPCGLENFSYPDAFPSPPEDLFNHASPETSDSSSSLTEDQRKTNERGWCYYLSEISVRRTIDETLNVLYRHGEDYWMKFPAHLIRQYYETERQVQTWHHHLPAVVQFDNDADMDEEFAAGLQGRALLWREYALRPVIYSVLHSPPHQTLPEDAARLAAEEMRICSSIVKRSAQHQRHGGIWLICRTTFTAACLILTAALHPDRVEPPAGWRAMIPLAVQSLSRWGRDAPDVQRMAECLEYMFAQVCRQREEDFDAANTGVQSW